MNPKDGPANSAIAYSNITLQRDTPEKAARANGNGKVSISYTNKPNVAL